VLFRQNLKMAILRFCLNNTGLLIFLVQTLEFYLPPTYLFSS
jgi:hypothetical protein